MRDMLNVELQIGDYFIYNNYLCKVLKSYNSSIKYITFYYNQKIIKTTANSQAILKLSDFNIDNINILLDNISSDLQEYSPIEMKNLSVEDIKKLKLEKTRIKSIQKTLKPLDILLTSSNMLFIYLGQILDDYDNVIKHTYIRFGYCNNSSNCITYINSVINNDSTRYYYLTRLKSKKQICNRITIDKQQLLNHLLTINTNSNFSNSHRKIIDILNNIIIED